MEKSISVNHVDNSNDGLLAVAALFEGYFSIDWLIDITAEKPSRVLSAMEEGVQQGFLSKKGVEHFCITNQKQKQKWLDLLDEDKQNSLHKKISAILMTEFHGDEEKVLILSGHLLHIHNDEEGCRWLMKGAEIHFAAFRPNEALKYYTKILKDLSKTEHEEENNIFISAAIRYSLISTTKENTKYVFSILEDAMKRAIKLKSLTHQALIKINLARINWLCANYKTALSDFEEGCDLAAKSKDPLPIHTVNTFIPHFSHWQGKFREAVQTYEQVVPPVEILPTATFPLVAAITVGVCYVHIGQVNQGFGMLDAIRTQFTKSKDPYHLAYVEAAFGMMYLIVHRPDEAINHLKSGLDKATQYQNYMTLYIGTLAIAFAYYQKGDTKKSRSYLLDYIKHSKEITPIIHPYPYLLEISWAIERGKYPKVPGLSFKKELQQMLRNDNIFLKGIAYRYKAAVEEKEGKNSDRVLSTLKKSYKALEETGDKVECAKTNLEIARHFLLCEGDKSKAREIALEAFKILSPIDAKLIPTYLEPLVKGEPLREDPLEEILSLSQVMVSTRNEKELGKKIISGANHFTGAERGAIFLSEKKGKKSHQVHLRASINITEKDTKEPEFTSSMKMIHEVIRTGKGSILGNNKKPKDGLGQSHPIRSGICVPMVILGKIVGALYNDNRLFDSAFKKSDIKVLSHFAAQAAIALDNAIAYERIRQLNKKLEEEKQYFEEQHLKYESSGGIIGESAEMKRLSAQLKQVAQTDTTVLVLGETGVGKNLAARMIHEYSKRNGPYISVQCSAMPETLISSELFGHEKGSFTGASSLRVGRFELANTGTLFLDEIGTLPMDVQIRLLRVLQSKKFERVGGSKTLTSDFRLIAATNVDLEQEVKAGRFRSDLFYRLNVFPIIVPPLRERIEDVPLLASHFLNKLSAKKEKSFRNLSENDIQNLTQYNWPGNVRELENIIERGIILSTGSRFELPDLLLSEGFHNQQEREMTLKENEKRHIIYALKKSGWKVHGKGGAAEILDINPSTLVSRIKKLGIQRPYGRKKKTYNRK